MLRRLKQIISLLCISLGLQVAGCAQIKEGDLDGTLQDLLTFSVDTLSAPTLQQELANGNELVLLDAREEKEFGVSHLSNARYVGYYGFKKKAISDIPKDAEIVVYCTVGYRSEKIAERLEKMGYNNVRNLYGGICGWVNNGYQVVDQKDQPTERVHTYDKAWGGLFSNGEKVYD